MPALWPDSHDAVDQDFLVSLYRYGGNDRTDGDSGIGAKVKILNSAVDFSKFLPMI